MIDRIASDAVAAAPSLTSAAADPARGAGQALAAALTGGDPVGTPLRVLASATAEAIVAVSGRGDAVGIGRLEAATLDFAREAKALAIGYIGSDAVRPMIDAALEQADVDLPTGDLLDRATTLFERAAALLSS